MKKKIAITQSNYIPWKGFFDLINSVDELVFLDEVQYTKGDWRNRNKIKTPNGTEWLTIPVNTKNKFLQKIKDTTISDPIWPQKHWKSIVQNYNKAPYFLKYADFFEELYLNNLETFLSEINSGFIKKICSLLNIKTEILSSSNFKIVDGKNERLLLICAESKATEYFSGPAAKNYLDETRFNEHNIKVNWMDYSNYPEYNQLYPPFVHEVSIIDLIFNEGPNANKYLKSFKGKL